MSLRMLLLAPSLSPPTPFPALLFSLHSAPGTQLGPQVCLNLKMVIVRAQSAYHLRPCENGESSGIMKE